VQLLPLWRGGARPAEGTLENPQTGFDRLPRKIDELDRYLTNNEIVRSRTKAWAC
jgi:NADH:ubiquinone oxidoreductase subunit D